MTVWQGMGALVQRGRWQKGLFGPLSPKRANRLYYRGTGANKGGRLTRKGNFIKMYQRMKFLNVPELEGFGLTPYVSKATPWIKNVDSVDVDVDVEKKDA